MVSVVGQAGKLASWQGVFGSASSTLASSRRCFVGGVEARCMSADMLYLASTRSSHNTGSVG